MSCSAGFCIIIRVIIDLKSRLRGWRIAKLHNYVRPRKSDVHKKKVRLAAYSIPFLVCFYGGHYLRT